VRGVQEVREMRRRGRCVVEVVCAVRQRVRVCVREKASRREGGLFAAL